MIVLYQVMRPAWRYKKWHISVVHLSAEQPACSKRNTLCDRFLIIKSFDIFGSFVVADFAFLICFYLFFSHARI